MPVGAQVLPWQVSKTQATTTHQVRAMHHAPEQVVQRVLVLSLLAMELDGSALGGQPRLQPLWVGGA